MKIIEKYKNGLYVPIPGYPRMKSTEEALEHLKALTSMGIPVILRETEPPKIVRRRWLSIENAYGSVIDRQIPRATVLHWESGRARMKRKHYGEG